MAVSKASLAVLEDFKRSFDEACAECREAREQIATLADTRAKGSIERAQRAKKCCDGLGAFNDSLIAHIEANSFTMLPRFFCYRDGKKSFVPDYHSLRLGGWHGVFRAKKDDPDVLAVAFEKETTHPNTIAEIIDWHEKAGNVREPKPNR